MVPPSLPFHTVCPLFQQSFGQEFKTAGWRRMCSIISYNDCQSHFQCGGTGMGFGLVYQVLSSVTPTATEGTASFRLVQHQTHGYFTSTTSWTSHQPPLMDITWLSHDYHTTVTWLSHGHHMTNTWPSHDCHMTSPSAQLQFTSYFPSVTLLSSLKVVGCYILRESTLKSLWLCLLILWTKSCTRLNHTR